MSSAARPRISSLDGLRGLAIALVVVHHAAEFSRVQGVGVFDVWLTRVAAELWTGVDLFFALSGFLITGILLSTREDPNYFRNFYIRRTLRIFPLYYAAVLAMCVVLPKVLHRAYLDQLSTHQLWYWFYIPNFWIFSSGNWTSLLFDHPWSLAIEEQFYLVWPLVVFALGARKLVPVTLLMAASSALLRVWMAAHGYTEAQIRVLPFSHADGLALGSLLASLTHLGTSRRRLRRLSLGTLLVGLVYRLGLLAPIVPPELRDNALIGSAWTLIFTGLVGLAVFGPEDGVLARALSTRPLTFLGTYSYGLYLIHTPVMMWAAPYLARLEFLPKTLGFHFALLLLVALGVSVALAMLSYRKFETPFLRLKARFE